MEIRTYEQNNVKHWKYLLQDTVINVKASFFLARQLAVRDIKAQYRQSYFGILWAFVTPITTALVWVFLSGSGIVSLTDTGVPYPVYAFVGTLIWSVLTESVVATLNTTNGAKSMLTKINFPKEALVLLGVYKTLFNTGIKALLLVVILLLYQVQVGWALLWFPLALMGVVVFGTTLGLFLTPIGLLYKDIGKLITIAFQFIMYISPVVYVIPKEGWTKTLMSYNPLTPLLQVTRNVLLNQPVEYLGYYLWVVGVSSILFLVALIIYRISIPVIIERISG